MAKRKPTKKELETKVNEIKAQVEIEKEDVRKAETAVGKEETELKVQTDLLKEKSGDVLNKITKEELDLKLSKESLAEEKEELAAVEEELVKAEKELSYEMITPVVIPQNTSSFRRKRLKMKYDKEGIKYIEH